MRVTAHEASQNFDRCCERAKREPVIVERGGVADSVIVNYADYQIFEAWRRQTGRSATRMSREEFAETYKEWIAMQHELLEKHGIPGESMRPW